MAQQPEKKESLPQLPPGTSQAQSSPSSASSDDKPITVPVLKYKLDAKTQALLGENFVLKEEDKGTKTEKEIKTVGNENITNLQKKQMLKDFHYQLMVAITSLKESLAGSTTAKATQESLRELLEGRPENSESDDDPVNCFSCWEKFSTDDKSEFYPYINSEGETLTRDCFKGKFGKESIYNRKKLLEIQYKDNQLFRVPNHDLANFIKNRPIFIDKFITVAALLLSGKAQPVAEEKSSHTTTTSSSSFVQAAVRPSHQLVDPDMMIFLLRMGLFQSDSLQNFSAEAIDNLLQVVCLTESLSDAFSDIIKELINKPDAEGRTPLMRAVEAENLPLAQALMLEGANIDLVDSDGNNMFHYLAKLVCKDRNEQSLSQTIITESERQWLSFFDTLLIKITETSKKESKDNQSHDKSIIGHINAVNKINLSPLILSIIKNNMNLSRKLMQAGSVLNKLNFPLLRKHLKFMIDVSNESMVEFLFEIGVDVYQKGKLDCGEWLTCAIFSNDIINRGSLKTVRVILQVMQDKAKADKTLFPIKMAMQVAALKDAVLLTQKLLTSNSSDVDSTVRKYLDVIDELLKHETELPKGFLRDLPSGRVKNHLQRRLKKAKAKENQKGLASSGQVVGENEGLAAEEIKDSAPAEIKTSANHKNVPPPEQFLTEQSQHCLNELKKVPSDEGDAYIEKLIAHWEKWGTACIVHSAQLVKSRKHLEASAFMDVFRKVATGWGDIIIDLAMKGFSPTQLEQLLTIISSRKDELSRLSERHRNAMNKHEAEVERLLVKINPQSPVVKEAKASSPLPEQLLAQLSKPYLDMLEQVPSLLGVASLDGVTKHFETEGSSCVRHLTQLLDSKQNGEALAFSAALMKILKEKQLSVAAKLEERGYSNSQLQPFIWAMNKKALEVNALMERLTPSVTPQEISATDHLDRRSVWGSPVTFLSSPPSSSSIAAESKISSNLSTQQSGNSSGVGSPPSFLDITTAPPSSDGDGGIPDEVPLQNLKSAKSKEFIDSLNKFPSIINKDNFKKVWKDFCSCADGCMKHLDNLNKVKVFAEEASAFRMLLVKKAIQMAEKIINGSFSEEQKEIGKQWIAANVHCRFFPEKIELLSESQRVNDKSFS